jgi:hypothetical protein
VEQLGEHGLVQVFVVQGLDDAAQNFGHIRLDFSFVILDQLGDFLADDCDGSD